MGPVPVRRYRMTRSRARTSAQPSGKSDGFNMGRTKALPAYRALTAVWTLIPRGDKQIVKASGKRTGRLFPPSNGHEPAGVYDLPHFDFHFYTVPVEVRNSIVPSDPAFATKAASFPAAEFRAPFYLDAATARSVAPALATVPLMGLHWLDVRSPELQMLTGHPEAFKPFTKTFIYGSWNGDFIFDEPMITRAYIVSKRGAVDPAVVDEIVPVPAAQRYAPNGYYPNAYRITYDAKAKEYRIALTQLSWRD